MLSKTRVAVMVSGGGTNLQALIDAQTAGKMPHTDIVLVISSSPTAFALQRAALAGIPSVTVSRKECNGNQVEFERRIAEALAQYDVDVIVLAGFMSILSEDFTSRWPRRIINVHPSLIPSFCGSGFYGLRVHEAALSYGVKVTGATVHFVNEIPDGGEIILQKSVAVRNGDTPEILQKRVMQQAEWKILPRACDMVCRAIQKGRHL